MILLKYTSTKKKLTTNWWDSSLAIYWYDNKPVQIVATYSTHVQIKFVTTGIQLGVQQSQLQAAALPFEIVTDLTEILISLKDFLIEVGDEFLATQYDNGQILARMDKLIATLMLERRTPTFGIIAGNVSENAALQTALDQKVNLVNGKVPADLLPEFGNNQAWGTITGELENQTDLHLALEGKSNLGHGHGIGEIQDLQLGLDSKADATLLTQHLNNQHNPHNTTALQVGADPVGTAGSYVNLHETTVNHPAATSISQGMISAADKTKLDSIQHGATANSFDEHLRDRSSHVGTQDASTITGLGGAAILNVGTVAGTVAAGNDPRWAELATRIINIQGAIISSGGQAVPVKIDVTELSYEWIIPSLLPYPEYTVWISQIDQDVLPEPKTFITTSEYLDSGLTVRISFERHQCKGYVILH